MLIIAMSNTGCSQQTANQSGTGVIGRFLLTVPIVGKLPGLKICNHKTGCVLDRVFIISELPIWQSHHRKTKTYCSQFQMSASCIDGKAAI